MKKHLFICGCPRSGTTALWRLLKTHRSIAVGVERFNNLVVPDFTLTKDCFENDRFFDYHQGDSHWKNLELGAQKIYYTNLKKRYNTCAYTGDKIPKLYEKYEQLFQEFPEVKIVFIVRNIFDVAQSYKVRFENEDDAWSASFDKSITDWNFSLSQTAQFLDLYPDQFICLEYEQVFYTQSDFNQVLIKLDLQASDEMLLNLSKERKRALELDDKKVLNLSTLEKRKIMHKADFKTYTDILKVSDIGNG